MSDCETGGSETGPSDAQTKTELLLREVFRPVFSRNSTALKRERPPHDYNFRKEAKEAASDGDHSALFDEALYCGAEDVDTGILWQQCGLESDGIIPFACQTSPAP